MKTLSRMFRRYLFAAVVMVVMVLLLNMVLFFGITFDKGMKQLQLQPYSISEIVKGFVMEDGYPVLRGKHSAQDWLQGYVWAMMLDDNGDVIWQYELAQAQNHHYTAREIASFSRWYLDDYPVFSYVTDYGLLVLAKPQGGVNRYNFYMDSEISDAMLDGLVPMLALDGGLVIVLCLLLGWGASKPLRKIGRGIDTLAEGGTVQLSEKGLAGELGEKLNRTGARLQRQSEIIARRDGARTNWIAGVSHDIRTPLSLIMGYAEQLGRDTALPAPAREKAKKIGAQSLRIKSLVEDLNLTSKLQYNAQPLRLAPCPVGPLLRRSVTEFCNGGLADACEVDFDLAPEAEQAVLQGDGALLCRAFENLLNNSARHNPVGCAITVRASVQENSLTITFADNGAGYPVKVLAALEDAANEDAQTPHILGLYLVRQIVTAHGGTVLFSENQPHGARAILQLSLKTLE